MLKIRISLLFVPDCCREKIAGVKEILSCDSWRLIESWNPGRESSGRMQVGSKDKHHDKRHGTWYCKNSMEQQDERRAFTQTFRCFALEFCSNKYFFRQMRIYSSDSQSISPWRRDLESRETVASKDKDIRQMPLSTSEKRAKSRQDFHHRNL
jgi:hypothetical protein